MRRCVAGSSARDNALVLVADWLTWHLSREAVMPMQASKDFEKYRYFASRLQGAWYAVGVRKSPPGASQTRLWLRYH